MTSVASMPISRMHSPDGFHGGAHSAVYSSGHQYYMSSPTLHNASPQHRPSPIRSASNVIVSPRGQFRISHYRSIEGEAGACIVIAVDFCHQTNETTFLRLVLGRRALTTAVRHIPECRYGAWELEAVVPLPDDFANPSTPVPLSVQALNSDNSILDSVIAGNFVYCSSPGPVYSTSIPRRVGHSIKQSNSSENLLLADSMASPRTSLVTISSKAFDAPGSRMRHPMPRSCSSRSRNGKASSQSLRPRKKQALMRTRRFGPGENMPDSQRVILDVGSPVETMAVDWTDEEVKVGRRLIRFYSQQNGTKLTVTCDHIKQDDYHEGDAVVSCIYRKDTNSCYVTSVDIICLLESLTNESFEIEEKNRIRRNLEGFRPKTVSKNRSGSEDFFQQIMDFPAPKPRNIEKDVKVFDWNVLPQALDKIISKYSLYSDLESGSVMVNANCYSRTSSSPPSDMMPIMGPSHSPSPYDSDRMTGSLHYASDGAFASASMHGSGFSQRSADMPYYARSDAVGSYSSFVESPATASSFSGTPSPRSHSSFGDAQCDPRIFTPEMHSLYPCNPMPGAASMSSLTVNSTAPSDGLLFDDEFSSLNSDCQPLMPNQGAASLDSFSLKFS
ncbi:unnamed protein product [Somion occarium]|uniref:DUF7082 domain-containing protein n=1 Tax=Somion occarium TaxID=3059160 RepID=A0ABP1DM34_9APHY